MLKRDFLLSAHERSAQLGWQIPCACVHACVLLCVYPCVCAVCVHAVCVCSVCVQSVCSVCDVCAVCVLIYCCDKGLHPVQSGLYLHG